jgi:hypothetical protein
MDPKCIIYQIIILVSLSNLYALKHTYSKVMVLWVGIPFSVTLL